MMHLAGIHARPSMSANLHQVCLWHCLPVLESCGSCMFAVHTVSNRRITWRAAAHQLRL
jgi:hypothetical protein